MRKNKKDKVNLEFVDEISTPIYRATEKGLEGPMTRTFREGMVVKATKLAETGGALHLNLGKGYVSFSIPTTSVEISRPARRK